MVYHFIYPTQTLTRNKRIELHIHLIHKNICFGAFQNLSSIVMLLIYVFISFSSSIIVILLSIIQIIV